jgi:hypothetical protein
MILGKMRSENDLPETIRGKIRRDDRMEEAIRTFDQLLTLATEALQAHPEMCTDDWPDSTGDEDDD